MPNQARPIGVTPIVTSAPETHRPSPQHFQQYAPTISERVDKVKLIPARETVPLIFLYSKTYINEEFFKKYKFCGLRLSNLRSARMWEEKVEEEAFVVFPKSTEINIQVNPKSCGFTKIISYLHSLVDAWDPDITLEMNLKQPELLWYGISEEYLRLRIEKYFLPKLEKYCKKS